MSKRRLSVLRGLGLLALLCALMAPAPFRARADVNLLPSGSVRYVHVSDAGGLRSYIDGNGSYSSEDVFIEGGKYGNTYKIILDEPGELLVYPLSGQSGITLELYADSQLNIRLREMAALSDSLGEPYHVMAEAGTYYYRIFNPGAPESKATVFVGFSPAKPQPGREGASPAPIMRPTSPPLLSADEMLNQVAMLEDILLANGLEFHRDSILSFEDMGAYINKLEQRLWDEGIDY